jgi:hypothetical protein
MVLHWIRTSRKVTLPGERVDSHTFKKFKSELYEYVKDHDMCKSLILPKYLKSAIINAKYVLISKTGTTIDGFLIFEIFDDELHIPLICSGVKGTGTKMLDAIFDYVNSNSNIKSVTLESIPEAFQFYAKKGFDIYCPEGELCPMIYKKK